jgi:hypothetical protein
MIALDRSVYRERWGNPEEWAGDWRRPGQYLRGEQQTTVHARLQEHYRLLVGMALRGRKSATIAAVFTVSRESIDRRLRPLGLKNPPGQVGRPPVRQNAA